MFFCAAFGFCEYEDPEATLRCIRLLNEWLIADKKLVVSFVLLYIKHQLFVSLTETGICKLGGLTTGHEVSVQVV